MWSLGHLRQTGGEPRGQVMWPHWGSFPHSLPCQGSRTSLVYKELLLAVEALPARVGEEVGAQQAREIHKDHGVEQDQVDHEEGALAAHLHKAHKVPTEVGLGRQAEEEVHHQVDVFVDLVEEGEGQVAQAHHHPDGQENVAHLHKEGHQASPNKGIEKDRGQQG